MGALWMFSSLMELFSLGLYLWQRQCNPIRYWQTQCNHTTRQSECDCPRSGESHSLCLLTVARSRAPCLRRNGRFGIIRAMKTTFHSIARNAPERRVVRLRGNLTPPPLKADGRAVGGFCAALCAILEGGRRAARIKGQKGRKRLKGRTPCRHFRPSSSIASPMSLSSLHQPNPHSGERKTNNGYYT